MTDNHILVVYSRWVYNLMGIILEANVSLIFSPLCILFKIEFQILVIFKPYTLEETVIENALHANECERWIEAFIAYMGHPLWGSQSVQELASGMRNVLPFLKIRDAKSCIHCELHKGCPRFAMNASIHLLTLILHAVLSLWRSLITYIGFENHLNLKQFFFKECIKPKK